MPPLPTHADGKGHIFLDAGREGRLQRKRKQEGMDVCRWFWGTHERRERAWRIAWMSSSGASAGGEPSSESANAAFPKRIVFR